MQHPEFHEKANFLWHDACPNCSSSDGMGHYDDGHGYCYVCKHYEAPQENKRFRKNKQHRQQLVDGNIKAIQKRSLTEHTCQKWHYQVGHFEGEPVQIANYLDAKGNTIAQKIRFQNKEFKFLGNPQAVELYGQWLWRDGGKMLVITEGEIDALSVSQIQQHKWPVVSVPNGAQAAVKAIKKSLDWLENFETVVFMFDNDKPGREAASECALLLSPGKAKIASLPLKDANEMLVAGRGKELIDAIWEAKTFRPDGIVQGADLLESILEMDNGQAVPYPWQGLTAKTHGLRKGELITFTAGSGIGKSLACREIAYHLIQSGETVGYIALEESVRRSALGLLGIHLSKPLHLSLDGIAVDELRTAFQATLGSNRVYFYDHFGSIDSENLLRRIRYLARGFDCNWIILDHLSIVVSGIGDGDERRLIDNTMTALRSMVEELGIGLILVSHLKRPEGKGHEEGAQTSLSQLRGSGAIAQLSDMVIGLERNQQDEKQQHLTCVRVLKNRFSGESGIACYLRYTPETGRLTEGHPDFQDETRGLDSDDLF
ncbi:MAG: DnaB-like helicase C-terminal domain-containing protein [Candidatus Melainabacteria bacterium]|nr:DnaB-like helicase C-terminal domain-containing protein [Candidatus Melainabacteria bacterium]